VAQYPRAKKLGEKKKPLLKPPEVVPRKPQRRPQRFWEKKGPKGNRLKKGFQNPQKENVEEGNKPLKQTTPKAPWAQKGF